MVIVFLGPPASGKGTQARKLAEKLNLKYLSTGDMLRDIKEARKDIAKLITEGKLVPDKVFLKLLLEYFEGKKIYDNLVLDGSPRSVFQYEKIKDWLESKGSKIDRAIFLDISQETAVKRISSRREDRYTGEVYNLITNPPGPEIDKKNLIIRDDDRPQVVKERFEVYKNETKPLVTRFKKEGILLQVDGEQPINIIFSEILAKIGIKND